MKLSIIVVTYNSEKDIYDCLHSLYRYNDLPEKELEVIIVDNQSREYEAMRARLSKDYPAVQVVQNTHNGGYGQGNNVGIRMATAPIVAIMNPDVRLLQPSFAAMLSCFQDNQVVMCGGKQMFPNNRLGWSFAGDYNVWWPIRIGMRNLLKRIDHYDYRFMHLSGAFFMVRKDKFEQIGLFDENLFMYAEEPDIHMRFRKQFPQDKMIFLPNLPYLHLSAEREFSEKRFRSVLNGDLYVIRKHGLSPQSYIRQVMGMSYVLQLRAYIQRDTKMVHIYRMQRYLVRKWEKELIHA